MAMSSARGSTRAPPIKPALDLGADRLVVIATDAVVETSHRPGRHEGRPPDLIDGALHLRVPPSMYQPRAYGGVSTGTGGKRTGIAAEARRCGDSIRAGR
jgi:NTE family protein